jgi:hypothetical protein
MLKKISVFAISVGLFAGAAFFIASGPSGVQAQEDALACAARPVALDEGYGVTRVEMRPRSAIRVAARSAAYKSRLAISAARASGICIPRGPNRSRSRK